MSEIIINMEAFWYKHRIMMGFDPDKPVTFLEMMYWGKIRKIREKCLNSDDPTYAITNAPYFDKQYLLEKWWDDLDDTEKRHFLKVVWQNKGSSVMYGYDWWIPFFKDVGFIKDEDVNVPTEPVVLYRGAIPDLKLGMPWSSNYDVAEAYAFHSLNLFGEKEIYKATINPESILAIFRGDFVDQDGKPLVKGTEYVINHQMLDENTIEQITNNSL